MAALAPLPKKSIDLYLSLIFCLVPWDHERVYACMQ